MQSSTAARNWQGRSYIAGRWRKARGEVFENLNPANTAEVLGHYPCLDGAAEVDEAVSST